MTDRGGGVGGTDQHLFSFIEDAGGWGGDILIWGTNRRIINPQAGTDLENDLGGVGELEIHRGGVGGGGREGSAASKICYSEGKGCFSCK